MISYFFLRLLGFIIALLPYRTLHAVGRILGVVIYYLHVPFKKKTMTNLAIAYGKTKTEKERKKIAKRAFQNLTITSLEFFRIKKSKGKMEEIVHIKGGDPVFEHVSQGKGIIFLTGHQANWEIPFIAMTERYSGIAIGRPIKNKRLYDWVLSVREMHGGKIVMPRQAIKAGLKALKEGQFLGIVGDQALPESDYSYPLFGTRAWTTPVPALLAYKTNSPIVVATTKRVKGKYEIEGSPFFWPDTSKPMKEEVTRLMDLSMKHLEKSIDERPHEWLWQHNRWKQQEVDHVKRKYRYAFVLIILSKNQPVDYKLFREIYPISFLTFLVPKGVKIDLPDVEVIEYENDAQLRLSDWRYQMVIDLHGSFWTRLHYLRRGAFQALDLKKMKKLAQCEGSIEEIIKKAVCKCP